MSHTTELIDRYKTKMGIESDYAAAKMLRLTPNALSNYRNGVSHADDKTAVLLADALGLDPYRTIARINSERAKKPEDRAFWKRIAAAAALFVTIALPGWSANANAAPYFSVHNSSGLHIMSTFAAGVRWMARILRSTLNERPALC